MLPFCESAIISSRWKCVLHNPDTLVMGRSVKPLPMPHCLCSRIAHWRGPWCICGTPIFWASEGVFTMGTGHCTSFPCDVQLPQPSSSLSLVLQYAWKHKLSVLMWKGLQWHFICSFWPPRWFFKALRTVSIIYFLPICRSSFSFVLSWGSFQHFCSCSSVRYITCIQ